MASDPQGLSECTEARGGGIPLRTQWIWSLVAVLPFLAVYVHHFTDARGVPTGFIQNDMPYYCANGRAIFERGNGLAYPNPYDPDPAAPVIYFQWLVWVLGFGVVKAGVDPGLLFVGVGLVGALACSWLTLRIVLVVLTGGRYRIGLFLLTMWAGGALCLARELVNALAQRPLGDDLFLYDPFGGWWFLNWGRNLIYPTESVYHALVAAAWLAVITRHPWWALVPAGLLACTHPFSGLQLLLMLLTWYSIQLCRAFSWGALGRWLAVGSMVGLLLFYYLVFLESFEQHRALRRVWSLEWTLSAPAILFGYGPVAALAVARVFLQRKVLGWDMGFWATCFVVSFLLANHQWFVSPRQPLHFTRGYVWMPLWLMGLPALQSGLTYLGRSLRPAGFAAAVALGGTLACLDNALFLTAICLTPGVGYYLSPDEREALRWVDAHHCRGVLLSPNPDLSYLAATYTGLRPYFGHVYNTPNYLARRERMQAWRERGEWDDIFAAIDFVLVEKNVTASLPRSTQWTCVYENESLVLWQVER
jgi:hypothetical protein